MSILKTGKMFCIHASLLYVMLAAALLAGCNTRSYTPEQYLAYYRVSLPDGKTVTVCRSIGCEVKSSINLSDSDWNLFDSIFFPVPPDAAAERLRIARAVGLMEEIAGERAGIASDRGRNYPGVRGSRQLDCRAESVNTTSFLLALQKRGFFAWHQVGRPTFRGIAKSLEPHNTAVIKEKTTGREFAVDSWFFDNGFPPVIVPLAAWLEGYDPDPENEKLNIRDI